MYKSLNDTSGTYIPSIPSWEVPTLKGTLLIGLGHKARHGKDSVGRMLKGIFQAVDYNAQVYSFAEALYTLCRDEYGMEEKDAPLLQRIGVQERKRDENVWVRKCFETIQATRPRIAIITDCRFPNEYAHIKQQGGLIYNVRRFNHDGSLFVDPSRPADHISETALDNFPFDGVIEGSSVTDLVPQVLALAARILA